MSIGSNTYKDGVLQGVIIVPQSGEAVDIRYIGSPLDLMRTAIFLGLEPVNSGDDETACMELKDPRGGYATLQPAERASDLLNTVAQMAREQGLDLPPFL